MRINIYRFLLFSIFCFSVFQASAQVSDYYNHHQAEIIRLDLKFQPGEQTIQEIVTDFVHEVFSLKYSSTFLLDNYSESPIGFHLSFCQYHQGRKVYNGTLKVNLDREYRINGIISNLFIIKDLQLDITDVKDFENYMQDRFRELQIVSLVPVIFNNNGQWVNATCAKTFQPSSSESVEWIFDHRKNEIQKRDLNLYFAKGGKDSIVSARVFLPDPLTTAGKVYGFPYSNRSDSDVVELNNERKLVRMQVTYSGDTFYLSNKYAKVVEASLPVTPMALKVSDTLFDYGRGKPQFEDVNAFYHINAFQKYIQLIGIINMGQMQYQIDAHAFNGLEQSGFIPLTVPPGLYYGIGGVNDAEDGEVIVHEYAHALSWSISPNTTSGMERLAIEEGNCDYLASSYTRSLNPFNWDRIFPWDGHNIYYPGRTINTTKKYPVNMVFDYYQNAEIWSSALMKIWESCGKEVTDKIVLNSLYSLSNDLTMPQAAQLVIIADSVLYGGIHYQKIFSAFAQHGILQWGVGLNEKPKPALQVINSAGFACNSGNAEIIVPNLREFELIVTDISGKEIIREHQHKGKLVLNPDLFHSGIYLIRIQTTDEIFFTKITKF